MKKILTSLFLITSLQYCISQELVATQLLSDYKTPDNDYIVETTIHKNPHISSIKFIQHLPPGFKASKLQTMRGDFCFQDNAEMIDWAKAPRSSLFTFTYALTIPKDTTGNITMNGNIFYDIDTLDKSFEILYRIIKIENVLASQKEVLKEMPVDSLVDEPATASVTPTPISGKSYRVQIAAYKVKKYYFLNVPELTYLPGEKGMTKFYSGDYYNLEEANQHRSEMVDLGYKDAFIVEFENGKPGKQFVKNVPTSN